MDKINKKIHSLKWSFFLYLPICLILSYLGGFGIGVSTNYLQDWYRTRHAVQPGPQFEIVADEDGNLQYSFYSQVFSEHKYDVTYWLISNTQILLIPLWVILCIGITGMIFYHCELKKPISMLLNASEKIAENKLDFQVQYKKQNEMGILCESFERMRQALYENNREMWHSLEERKRLNSAFSHDLRTPLTVLKGYVDFLQRYVPDGKVTEEKLLGVLSMMNGQIIRLEHYTQKMNAVQKLEDIIPDIQAVSIEAFSENLTDTGKMLCDEKQLQICISYDISLLFVDCELVMQVYENIISNAVRYAVEQIDVQCSVSGNMLKMIISDDGEGFTDEALKNAVKPFFRDEKESSIHFGLGLYICRVICEKCGGSLIVSNHQNGGRVTALFSCEKISENR